MPPNDDTSDLPAPRAASVPEHAAGPDPKVLLDHIAEVSRNASATWFGLLGLLAFVGITLLGHRDADFFARGAGTQLPLVNITVPVEAFFLAAPALVAAVYAYFHLYLMTLWDALADAPPRIDNQPLSDRIYPWLLSYAALWYRDRRRRDGSSAPRPLGRTVVAIALIFGWLSGIIVLAGLWWRSMPAHNEWLTLWAGACLWFAALIGQTGFESAIDRMAGASRDYTANKNGGRGYWATAYAAMVAFLSWETTEGSLLIWTDSGEPILLVSANLYEAELTPRPPEWKPFELWLRDLRHEREIGDPNQNPLIPTKDETERYRLMIAALGAPSLKGRDLRNADLSDAFMAGADLRGTQIQGVNFFRAQMQGVDLRGTDIAGAEFFLAHLQGANFSGAEIRGRSLQGAHLQGASLSMVRMQGAQLSSMVLANAPWEVVLGEVQLHGAGLSFVEAPGANLPDAQMQGADLYLADLRAANLPFAQMADADCTGADFFAALVPSADLTCRSQTLTQSSWSSQSAALILCSPMVCMFGPAWITLRCPPKLRRRLKVS